MQLFSFGFDVKKKDSNILAKRINPLQTNDNYSYRIINISFSKKKEGIKKKISYERCVYESVDDESLS